MTSRVVSIGAMLAAASVAWPATAAPGLRSRLDLNGDWQSVATTDPAESAPGAAAEWKAFSVPGTAWLSPAGGTHFLWLRRDAAIPAEWAGQRVFVNLRGARYAPRLYVDGRLAGARLDGLSPFLVEVTDRVRAGSTHRFDLRCQDRGAGFAEGFVLAAGAGDDAVRGQVLLPVGGYKEVTGPWGDIWLEARPLACLDDEALVLAPSVRRHELTVTGRATAAPAGSRVLATVLDGDRGVLSLGPVPVAADGGWTLVALFADARCWSPEDPHLYRLRAVLLPPDGETPLDRLETRFGFKEVWADGADIVLNGVKRHLLAASTWPVVQHEPAAAIRAKVEAIKAQGCNAFRLHIGPWQEAWLEAADEVGLMLVVESALYTDGSGFYAYRDERFWANCRDHIRGMIGRDRNHASVVMWSLCNEILFMGNQRYDADLPRKLGDLGRYAKSLDPQHLITFEADRDPDGAADVVGLHYPHELPANHDYPNTCDWLGGRIRTEAAGGLLGQHSGDFLWDRRKPLYIGEYLWVPHSDFAVGSVFFGDLAYRNRVAYHQRAQTAAFHDQTLAYRRSGVSGMCPWAVYGFGGAPGTPERVSVQERFYRPVAAFLRNRGLRLYAGEKATLRFDVFNDSDRPLALNLQVRNSAGAVLTSSARSLAPGGYQDESLPVTAPDTAADTVDWPLTSVLLADGTERWRDTHAFRVFARPGALAAPAGARLVTCDRDGAWVAALAAAPDPARTVLLLPAGVLAPTAGVDPDNLPRIGAVGFDTPAFASFLARGGRALVCEQPSLAALGLGLTVVDHGSTMTFPLRGSHPLVDGLAAADFSFWRDDNLVARRQVRRPAAGGARTLVVSGGPDALAQSPVVEMPAGSGRVLVVQALAGARRETDPAAARLLDNALRWLLSLPAPAAGRAVSATANAEFARALRELGVAVDEAHGALTGGVPADAPWLLLSGGSSDAAGSAESLRAFLARGGGVYWHAPDPAAFAALRDVLGAPGLRVLPTSAAASLADREQPLLDGVSREDVTYTTVPQGWDRTMRLLTDTTRGVLLPESAAGADVARLAPADAALTAGELHTADGRASLAFARRGSARWSVPLDQAGVFPLRVRAVGTREGDVWPQVLVEINGEVVTGFSPTGDSPADYVLPVGLGAGVNTVELRFSNGSEWGGGRRLTLGDVTLGARVMLPAGAEVLVAPGAVVTWPAGRGQVVIDGLDWTAPGANAVRGRRWANALLANLGVPFAAPAVQPAFEDIPLGSFRLVGESPYSDLKPDRITLRAAGTVGSGFECVTAGTYRLRLDGSSSPCKGVHAVVRVEIDGAAVGDTELASTDDRPFAAGTVRLTPGRHTVTLTFTNDASADGEDRNLFLRGFALARQTEPAAR